MNDPPASGGPRPNQNAYENLFLRCDIHNKVTLLSPMDPSQVMSVTEADVHYKIKFGALEAVMEEWSAGTKSWVLDKEPYKVDYEGGIHGYAINLHREDEKIAINRITGTVSGSTRAMPGRGAFQHSTLTVPAFAQRTNPGRLTQNSEPVGQGDLKIQNRSVVVDPSLSLNAMLANNRRKW